MSIRYRLILAFIACLLFSFIAITVTGYINIHERDHDRFRDQAEHQLEHELNDIAREIEECKIGLRYLAGTNLVRRSRGLMTSYVDTIEITWPKYSDHTEYEKKLYDTFIHFLRMNPDFSLVAIANDDGQFLQVPEGRSKEAGYDPRERPWYQEMATSPDDICISSPYKTLAGETVVSILSRTRDMEGKPLGVIGMLLDLKDIITKIESRSLFDSGYLVMLDDQGSILAHGNRKGDGMTYDQATISLWAEIFRKPDGEHHAIDINGVEKYIVSKSFPLLDWKLAVVLDNYELHSSPIDLTTKIISISSVFVLASIGFILLVANSIIMPLERLMVVTHIIADDKYYDHEQGRQQVEETLDMKGTGETTHLASSLKTMIAKLQEKIDLAKQSSQAKSIFLANMSHEIRTPLNAIVGMTTIGKKTVPPEYRHIFDRIDGASTHLLGVINDVLDLAKIESGKMELAPVRFDFKKMLQRIADMHSFTMQAKRLDFHLSIDPVIPEYLIGDDQRLAQVVTNLLSNAMKFTPAGKKVSIEAQFLSEESGSCTLQISVRDEGIGIRPEAKESLFQPFEQAEQGTSRTFGGTGLGLAISKRIVEMMDGQIWCDSEPGKGTNFYFTMRMPWTEGDTEDSSDTSAIPDSLENIFQGRTLLLAEDVDINREILIALLEETGIGIDCAGNGQQAIDLFKNHPEKYDLIFMDIQMPEMDGIEATRQIRALDVPKAKTIPIIALTANVFREEVEQYMKSGMDGHLGKPLEMDKVIALLYRYIGSPPCSCSPPCERDTDAGRM